MRIPDVSKIAGIYDQHKNVGRVGKTEAVAAKKDIRSISSQAKDFQTVYKALKDVPDIRQPRVDELSLKYESGGYDVDGKDIMENVAKNTYDRKA